MKEEFEKIYKQLNSNSQDVLLMIAKGMHISQTTDKPVTISK